MLRIRTRINLSQVHGIGLFADQFIPKGTVTWSYDKDFDNGFTESEINSLPDLQKSFILYYSYYDISLHLYVLCCDCQRYINHSISKANIYSQPNIDIALRDILRGEELLCDYYGFDPNYFSRVGVDPSKLID